MSLDRETQTAITKAVDAAFDRQVDFLSELVRFPSLRGQEHTAQNFVHDALAERGYAMDRWQIKVEDIEHHEGFSPVKVSYDNAINVVGTHTPKATKGRSLVLNGHIDVVPTGPADMWSEPPFSGAIKDGWLYGRGSGDMKAGIAANIFALDALKAAGCQPAGMLYQQSVTEEECTGNGALAALVRGYKADAALISEPMDDCLTRANVGVLWFQVKLRGVPVHVSHSQGGNSAILGAMEVIKALQALENDWNAQKAERPLYANETKPITINIGKIAGGDWASSVPAWCTLDCRASIYADWEPETKAREIEATIRAACRDNPFLANNPPEVVYNGFFARGYVLEEGSDAEAALAQAFSQVHEGAELQDKITPAYLDGRVFTLYGDCPCLVYGPTSEHIHGFDERVSLDSLRRVTKTIALFTANWCGLEAV